MNLISGMLAPARLASVPSQWTASSSSSSSVCRATTRGSSSVGSSADLAREWTAAASCHSSVCSYPARPEPCASQWTASNSSSSLCRATAGGSSSVGSSADLCKHWTAAASRRSSVCSCPAAADPCTKQWTTAGSSSAVCRATAGGDNSVGSSTDLAKQQWTAAASKHHSSLCSYPARPAEPCAKQ